VHRCIINNDIMKKLIIPFIAIIVCTTIKAQYAIINKMVLPELAPKDSLLLKQLDSILAISPPYSYQIEDKYCFYIRIKEEISNKYKIVIVYARPSELENDLNTGICYINDTTILIIREETIKPLFKPTGNKIEFKYRKLLQQDGIKDNYLIELFPPEEFFIWILSFSENQLKIVKTGMNI